ncbi:hypothetical protein [Citrobacter braakii]|uniref:hypothetical protein n=1 Tax=Citrobacter braakii TaxID=57706 RepID=UPI00403970DA
MTALNKQALRGQSVEGSYYLAECGHCGEMYPSNKLRGGEPLFSGDYGECFCHLCGADDTDIADYGAWGSEAVTAWNYQQKCVEALLDELEVISKSEWKLAGDLTEAQMNNTVLEKKLEAAEKRSAELIEFLKHVKKCLVKNGEYAPLSHEEIDTLLGIRAAGIGVNGE